MVQQTSSKCSVAGKVVEVPVAEKAGKAVGVPFVGFFLMCCIRHHHCCCSIGRWQEDWGGCGSSRLSLSLGQDEYPCRRTSHPIPIEIGGNGVCCYFRSFGTAGNAATTTHPPAAAAAYVTRLASEYKRAFAENRRLSKSIQHRMATLSSDNAVLHQFYHTFCICATCHGMYYTEYEEA